MASEEQDERPIAGDDNGVLMTLPLTTVTGEITFRWRRTTPNNTRK
jgi:hypothetical protein